MATDNRSKLQSLVITHLQDAYAMEQNVLGMLDSMITQTTDPQMKQLLQQHLTETQQHANRAQARLHELGETTSLAKNAGATMTGWMKTVADSLRSEKTAKNLRDGFVAEHLEIAGYELLERIARRAGDTRTVDIAHLNKQDEIEMAKRLNDLWDRAVDLTLLEEGLDKDTLGVQTGSYGARADAAERSATWTNTSAEADMGIGFSGTQSDPNTSHDYEQGNIPTQAETTTRTIPPRTRNP